MPPLFKLCYITDRHALEPRPVLPVIRDAIRAGVDLIQVREKDLETRHLAELVETALREARGTRTAIVVNDRFDVALALGAAGVHLGTHSLAPAIVRRHAPPGFLVGVSCHSLEEADAAEAAGADYILFGPVFATPSKLRYGPPLGLEKLREATSRIRIPLLALGGVTVERTRQCLEAGAAGIAGISIFQNSASIEAVVRKLESEVPRLRLPRDPRHRVPLPDTERPKL